MRSRPQRIAKMIAMFLVFFPLFVFVGGEIILHLWNWLMPALFGIRTINFWQAVGLLILTRILFGGFGCGGSRRSDWRHRMSQRIDHMSPEEREAMRRQLNIVLGVPGAEGKA